MREENKEKGKAKPKPCCRKTQNKTKLPPRPTLFKFDPQILYIRPKYDHCLALSVPEFLTHSSCWIHATFPKATQPFLVLSSLVKSVSSKELIGFRKPMQCLFGRQSCRQLIKVVKWICYSCYMDLLKLLHVIVKTGICISRPTKPVWSLSKILTLVDWLRAVNRVDRLTALGPDVHCAFGNVYISDQFFWHGFPFLG